MANEEHSAILKQGVDTWKRWRQENLDVVPDLDGADLSGADLRRAHLVPSVSTTADFVEADLGVAGLSTVTMDNISIGYTNLTDIDLSSFVNAIVFHVGPPTVDHGSI